MPSDTATFSVNGQTYHIPGHLSAPGRFKYVDSVLNVHQIPYDNRQFILKSLDLHRADVSSADDGSSGIFLALLVVGAVLLPFFNKAGSVPNPFEEAESPATDPPDEEPPTYYPHAMLIKGKQLAFTDAAIHQALEKRHPFFRGLSAPNKAKFLKRLKRFMAAKDFVIHHENGFREMPILIGAAAIQLTFGLRHYMLSAYWQVHIHPEEYFGSGDLRILAGNVQGRRIALSWKHFLEGFHYPENGENVGLHEMAHALYGQVFWFDKRGHRAFKKGWFVFQQQATVALAAEQQKGKGVYSDNGKRNLHEFWAESVELFFEKPLALHGQYPQMYRSLCQLLKQNHALS
jgi:MtfA peptidase